MNPITQTLVRSILKILAGALVAKGLADESTAETITAGAIGLGSVAWGVLHRKTPAKSQAESVPVKVLE